MLAFLKCSMLAFSLSDARIHEVNGREIDGYKCYHDDTTDKYFYWNEVTNKSLWPNQMRKLAKIASQKKSIDKKASHNKRIFQQKKQYKKKTANPVAKKNQIRKQSERKIPERKNLVAQKNQTPKQVDQDSIPFVPYPLGHTPKPGVIINDGVTVVTEDRGSYKVTTITEGGHVETVRHTKHSRVFVAKRNVIIHENGKVTWARFGSLEAAQVEYDNFEREMNQSSEKIKRGMKKMKDDMKRDMPLVFQDFR